MLEFVYDHMGRRVQKKVSGYNLPPIGWSVVLDERYVYDGWNVVLMLSGTRNTVVRKLTWGLDLSGSLHGAGGIGGLLAVEEVNGTNDGTYWFLYDGNGNVTQAIKEDTTPTLVVHYEYDPYGDAAYSSGTYAAVNPIRFSTKWRDWCGTEITGEELYYYGERYYWPRIGRWGNGDPMEEKGGVNLYSFVRNSAVNSFDPLGLKCCLWMDYDSTMQDFGAWGWPFNKGPTPGQLCGAKDKCDGSDSSLATTNGCQARVMTARNPSCSILPQPERMVIWVPGKCPLFPCEAKTDRCPGLGPTIGTGKGAKACLPWPLGEAPDVQATNKLIEMCNHEDCQRNVIVDDNTKFPEPFICPVGTKMAGKKLEFVRKDPIKWPDAVDSCCHSGS